MNTDKRSGNPKMRFEIKSTAGSSLKVRHSRFISHIFPIADDSQIKPTLKTLSTKYPDASHICWAYILGLNGDRCYYSDAGEPPSSGGLQILNLLKKERLTNVLCCVVRYYGGVKLGKKRLGETYYSAAKMAVDKTEKSAVEQKVLCKATLSYATFERIKSVEKMYKLEFIEIELGVMAQVAFRVPKRFLTKIKAIVCTGKKREKFELLDETTA